MRILLTGASRGIGKAIALRAARDGANIAVVAKTDQPHPTLPGTVHSAVEEIEAAGGTMADIVKLNTYVTDGRHFDAIRELRGEFFDQPFPAATSMVVHSLARRELVMEIEAIAILDD